MSDKNNWHKIAAALANKLGGDVTLGIDDFSPLDGKTVVVEDIENGEKWRVRVMPTVEAERLFGGREPSAKIR